MAKNHTLKSIEIYVCSAVIGVVTGKTIHKYLDTGQKMNPTDVCILICCLIILAILIWLSIKLKKQKEK